MQSLKDNGAETKDPKLKPLLTSDGQHIQGKPRNQRCFAVFSPAKEECLPIPPKPRLALHKAKHGA